MKSWSDQMLEEQEKAFRSIADGRCGNDLNGYYHRYLANKALLRMNLTLSYSEGFEVLSRLLGYCSVREYKKQLKPEHHYILKLLDGPHGYTFFQMLKARAD